LLLSHLPASLILRSSQSCHMGKIATPFIHELPRETV
jgi:hypothetical protein